MRKKYPVKAIKALLTNKGPLTIVKKLCGEKIGSGAYRDVYVLKAFPDYVVKIERDMSTARFANVTEWQNYVNNAHWNLLDGWLAPCLMINQTGSVLVQQRVTPGRRKDYPKYIPAVFTDLKLQNSGWIDGKFCCCDYSFMTTVIGKKKMKYAKWWNEKA